MQNKNSGSSADRSTILVVDDTPENIDVIGGVLKPHYKLKVALNGEKAIRLIQSTSALTDMILLDIMMPGLDGYAVCRWLKANPDTHPIPVIFLTAMAQPEDEARGLALGAVDYITKPIRPPIVMARIRTHLALYDQNRALEGLVRARTAELEASRQELASTRLEIIRRLGRAAEFKDNETGLHIIRMSHYSRLLAQAATMPHDQVELIYQAAAMHDIGKIGIPDRLLEKNGPLDADEWAIMRRHPEIGARIIGIHDNPLLRMAHAVALTHHEKWAGNGYPMGLKGTDIPLEGRIVAIADVFDALTSVRPYKKAWPMDKAIALLESERGQHFDPELVPHFLERLPEVKDIMRRYAESTAVHENDVTPTMAEKEGFT
jgi:putative two-component system response regulator